MFDLFLRTVGKAALDAVAEALRESAVVPSSTVNARTPSIAKRSARAETV